MVASLIGSPLAAMRNQLRQCRHFPAHSAPGPGSTGSNVESVAMIFLIVARLRFPLTLVI